MSAKISQAVRDAIKDPFVLGDVQPEWTVPDVPPPIADLRRDIAALKADLAAAPKADATWCLTRLRRRFGVGSNEADKATWLQALTAFPHNMLFATVKDVVSGDKRPTLESFTRHPGLVRRQTDLARAQVILAAVLAPKPAAPFVRVPAAIRFRQLRDSAHRRGDTAAAATWERDLAEAEGREPEAWAVEVRSPASAPVGDDREADRRQAQRHRSRAASTPRQVVAEEPARRARRAPRGRGRRPRPAARRGAYGQ